MVGELREVMYAGIQVLTNTNLSRLEVVMCSNGNLKFKENE